ncbi:MAG: hypothetical protein H6659_03760 [Ardenticatenaceae bacterium]|nr:hypothetical protein [Ardenticatenaceae bacterium]MCB8986376.1 hypothetical protein [Ardenticatenaceae bacterium]
MTAFPPPDFVRTSSAVPGIDVYMPRPPAETHQAVVDFHCPQCDGVTAYSAENGGLTCTFCGYYEPPRQEVVGKGAAAFEFTVETMDRAAQGWGVERKELVCERCAARLTLSTDSLTTTCPFCGSNQVIQAKAPQDVLRPRFLVPFSVTADTCREKTAVWLTNSWMLPSDLKRLARTAEFAPIYIPYWTFDATTQADWRAEVAHTRQKRVFRSGRWETETVTEWRWESGRAGVDFDDLLVDGSQHLSQLLLHKVQKYDLRALVPYDASFLAGMQAQAYEVGLEEAWENGRQTMRERTKKACQAQATSQRIRNFSMNLSFADENWRYILLPLYLATYRYNGQPYQVMINGQTAVIAGQRPVAWKKVLLAVGGMLAPALILGLVAFLLLYLAVGEGYGGLAAIAAVVAFVIGLVVAIVTVSHAAGMDNI